MGEGLFNKIMKKTFTVNLDARPDNTKWFIDEIERYCIKDKLNYRFVSKDNPALIAIDDVIYKCTLEYFGRSGWMLHFKEE